MLTPVVFEHVHFTLKCKTNRDKSKFITSKQLQFDYIYFSLITSITRLHGTFVDTDNRFIKPPLRVVCHRASEKCIRSWLRNLADISLYPFYVMVILLSYEGKKCIYLNKKSQLVEEINS